MPRAVNPKTGEITGGEKDEQTPTQRLAEIAAEIRSCYRRTSHEVVTIGQRFIEAKLLLPHGQFIPWIGAEFGITERTAENFMNVARRFFGKTEIVSALPPTVLYSLAAPSTPDGAIDEVLNRIQQGEQLKPADIDLVIDIKSPHRRAVQAGVRAGQRVVGEILATQGHVSISGESVSVAGAITQSMKDDVEQDTQVLVSMLEHRDGVNGDEKYTGRFTVVSASARDGFVTLIAPELAAAVTKGQSGTYIVYVKVEVDELQ
jgi:hypothetical protein